MLCGLFTSELTTETFNPSTLLLSTAPSSNCQDCQYLCGTSSRLNIQDTYRAYAPSKVLLEIGVHVLGIKAGEFSSLDRVEQRRRKGDHAGNISIASFRIIAFVAVHFLWRIGKDAMCPNQIGIKGPTERIGAKLAQEDVDEE